MARPTLYTNRKFLRLAQMIGSEAAALGHLEFLWAAANETGNPVAGDATDVEVVAKWRGETGRLVEALTSCGSGGSPGFIVDRGDGIYEIHDYWDHAPDYVRKRAKREGERRSRGDELRSLTGQRPVSDRSLSSTPAPAPAPAREEEEHPPSEGDAARAASLERALHLLAREPGSAEAKRAWMAREHPLLMAEAERMEPENPKARSAAFRSLLIRYWRQHNSGSGRGRTTHANGPGTSDLAERARLALRELHRRGAAGGDAHN